MSMGRYRWAASWWKFFGVQTLVCAWKHGRGSNLNLVVVTLDMAYDKDGHM